jgi:predicted homoserine dehydrogenase-like protein
MIIVDRALKAREEQGKPIRVGMVGAGFMGQGLTNQIENSVPGMRMAAIYNRKPERAFGVYRYAGCDPVVASSQSEPVKRCGRGSRWSPKIPSSSPVVRRSLARRRTGFGGVRARVILEAFAQAGVLTNAEVDATIGPILRVQVKAKHLPPPGCVATSRACR